ncbi:tRNA (adenosine(37)-N6)-threonylcarbamoyltransferase complex dimerization subunit type 1 TsaB [Iamia sp. SCSIO 61187]|uniref:tRNA (adenosine(37)-N6)-threonylcarbamoyltransferase complex dimerization subunit type 1 TsaB n=1 Tax=Iamia sp. SCSIO 61187 TaxID=2722752 RepID=UPI001C62E187|nr:tRNA (adenosine(37)-N6)-threonylcarbamoyltransferase complex dimerization subunit type 1 TsaB [Iamia sp. SCSIO 61187]QYG94771.1 tRNA (adenosine(37)-N6)-threonylcarbamoyltransferase complex dimerization subunit type 1 TsaB [Iamia sp. SCSIO 61187]
MLILGIESATAQVGCAVGGHEGVLASAHSSRSRRHAESLTPSIEFVCRQARVELAEIGAVAVDIGPGLFTGLRVGVATAKAVAQALRVPVIPISSLDLLAFPARFTDRLIAAVIDARRGELFSALYRTVPGGVQRITEPRVSTPDDLRAELQAHRGDLLLVGDGALRYQDEFRSLVQAEVVTHGLAGPSARDLVLLAHHLALREEWVQPWDVTPTYLRKPDAEISWATREGVPGPQPGSG